MTWYIGMNSWSCRLKQLVLTMEKAKRREQGWREGAGGWGRECLNIQQTAPASQLMQAFPELPLAFRRGLEPRQKQIRPNTTMIQHAVPIPAAKYRKCFMILTLPNSDINQWSSSSLLPPLLCLNNFHRRVVLTTFHACMLFLCVCV